MVLLRASGNGGRGELREAVRPHSHMSQVYARKWIYTRKPLPLAGGSE
jgi:hypothetical protein